MTTDNRRYHGLDALRGVMMMLGIVLHASMFYLVAPEKSMPVPVQVPLPADRETSFAFNLIFHFIHSFRMPTFFVLAGFFTSLLLEKRGLWGTYKNRGARVLAPLLAGIVTVLPLAGLFMIDFMLSVRFGTHDILPDRAQLKILGSELRDAGAITGQVSLGHLWFLYYLCLFYLLIPVCRWLVESSRTFAPQVNRVLMSPASLILFGLYTAVTLWPFRAGMVHEGFIFLTPHVPSLVYYGSFFVLGYFFHQHRSFLQTAARMVPWCAGFALVLFPLSLFVSRLELAAATPSIGLHLAAVMLHGLCTWSLIYLFIGGALRYFDFESPWILYTSQSSYWVFLLHLPAVCFAGWLLLPYRFPAIAKFLVVVAITSLICFVTYHYLVRKTWVSVFLNGRRFDLDWPWRRKKFV